MEQPPTATILVVDDVAEGLAVLGDLSRPDRRSRLAPPRRHGAAA